jgi:hypothetical protein
MGKEVPMGTVTKVIGMLLVLAIFLSSMSLVGCRGKTESTYGPGAAWIDDMRGRIEDKIEDPRKTTELLVVVDNIELIIVELNDYLLNYYNKLESLDSDYNATREDFQVLFDDFSSKRDEMMTKLLKKMFEMKRIAGREDWVHLADIDKTLYETWQQSPSM